MRVRIGGAIGLVAVALVVACNGGDQPSTLPANSPTSSDASATTTDSPTPTGDPTAELEAEITAFYELYVETINQSWTSEEALQRRKNMFVRTCIDCQRGYELAKRAHTEDLTLKGGVISVTDVSVDNVETNHAVFTSVSNSSAGTLEDRAGNVVQSLIHSANLQIVFQVERSDSNEWRIMSSQVTS